MTVPPGGAIEVRFQGAGRSIGRARLQMTVQMGNERERGLRALRVKVEAERRTHDVKK